MCGTVLVMAVICAVLFNAKPFDTFFWSGAIGTLILLVAYLLATIGAVRMLWFRTGYLVPLWQIDLVRDRTRAHRLPRESDA